MLKGIDPVLSGELLAILDQMGHGDTLLLVDRNYPAHASGNPVVHLGEISTTRAAAAILSVFPLDTFVERPLGRMEVRDDPSIVLEAHDELLAQAEAEEGRALEFEIIPRFEFYSRALSAFAIVQTLDDRPYACFALTKGVV